MSLLSFNQEQAALLTLGGGVCDIHSLSFTSGVMADGLLMASLVASHYSPHTSFSRSSIPDSIETPPA